MRRLGDYRLVSSLGHGGMGDVYFGVSSTADRVAVKVIRPHLLDNPTARQRFAAEVESLRLVWGSRVARLEDADPLGDPAWLAVEYVPGLTLAQYVERRGPLPPAVVAMLGAMLVDGLDRVHQAGLLHRDLKPSNIILGGDGPVLIDFGLAVIADRDDYLTDPGGVVGTPDYMAPERVRGEPDAGPESDVYGLGATLVFALTGHRLYPQAKTLPALLFQIADPAVLPEMSGVPAEVAPVLGAMLAYDPSARPGLPAVRERLLAVATADGAPAADVRQRLTALTFDGSGEPVVPPVLDDPLRDPEEVDRGGGSTDEDPAVSPPDPGQDTDPDLDDRAPASDQQRVTEPGHGSPETAAPDVGWLIDQLRRQYARRATL
ncbi:serine/threonine-protein kinase [Plantactinospora sp. B5E13]|uniref:serine/threonine-protein kinase n=1 Tax=Plantactinospora sp. B5E13 TaxID=3153758 RepID=UPI00325DD0ED